jgi:protein-disulfide isomerase
MAEATNTTLSTATDRIRQPRPALRWLAVALACTAAYVCVQLERVSYGGAASALVQRLCGGDGPQSDCRSVLMSKYGSVPLAGERSGMKLPVATLGSMYFVFVAIWYLFVGPVTRERRYVNLIILGVVAIGVLVSLAYVRVMAVVLREWCGGCLVVHGINAALLLVTIAAWPWRAKPAAATPHPSNRLLGATLAAGILAATTQFGFALFFLTVGPAKRITEAYERVTSDPAYVLWDYGRQPLVEIPGDAREPLMGDPKAPHSIVVFTDFACPRCKVLHGELERIVAKFSGRVRVTYRHFPLDPACNPHPKWARGGHRGACAAAQVFEAVRATDRARGARFAALLFERQTALEGADLAAWADELAGGPPVNAGDSSALERIHADIELGASLGLNDVGTPVLYLDGRRFDGWQIASAWVTLLGCAASGPVEVSTP